MKIHQLLLFFALIIPLFNSCDQQESEPEPPFEKSIKQTTIEDNEQLSILFQSDMENGRVNGTRMETEYGILLLDQVVETIANPNQIFPNFSIRLLPPNEVEGTIEYLILTNQFRNSR